MTPAAATKPKAPPKSKSAIRFTAKFMPAASGQKSDAAILTLPAKAAAALGTRGNIMVEGAINSFPFRAAVEVSLKGIHSLAVNKSLRRAAGADALETVTVEITRAGDEPEMRVPDDLREALAAKPRSQAGWEDITPLARRDWIFSITSAKQPETRVRRIEKAIDMLATGKRRLCCFPGVKWIMRDNEKTCGMWQPLPNSKEHAASKSKNPD
jgi:Bacteriocin-protection, YdeI or OmpD-Associated/Domain of unknown function (DUF1905)